MFTKVYRIKKYPLLQTQLVRDEHSVINVKNKILKAHKSINLYNIKIQQKR